VTAVADPPKTARLLTGLGPDQRADLSTHLSVHGPLSVPTRRDDRWSETFIDLLAEAGLTGRGGAGFPTAAKLRWIREQRRQPVLAVNLMEGEPASRKDLVLAGHVPHLVLDGAAAVARCVDAQTIFLCVPSDARATAASLADALRERAARGFDPLTVELVRPPGRYIAGEESALSSWLDGGETLPEFRPDRPAVNRVGGRPCLVDNAETLAHVALIARYGAAAFRDQGTHRGAGTTLVTVSGAVALGGVYEIPLGTSLSSVLAMAGGQRRPGALLLGGYGGTWLSADHFDASFDPASLRTVGATTGAGVVVVLPEGACGLLETARIAAWMAGESAGQCGPCVFGLPALAEDLFLLAAGRPRVRDVERLRSRLGLVDGRGACHHPDGVVRLVRSALTVFADDLDHHLAHGPCAGTRQPSVLLFPAPRVHSSPR
jgi:NADH:ubiquinone oxidoreductase subunit F (NADH-binding)